MALQLPGSIRYDLLNFQTWAIHHIDYVAPCPRCRVNWDEIAEWFPWSYHVQESSIYIRVINRPQWNRRFETAKLRYQRIILPKAASCLDRSRFKTPMFDSCQARLGICLARGTCFLDKPLR